MANFRFRERCRWSKIAQYLPGRTDNEIKNYWRTRVQKHAKQLRCDVNSKQFKDAMRHLWMPRLAERIRAASGPAAAVSTTAITSPSSSTVTTVTGSGRHHFENNLGSMGTCHTNASSSDSFGEQRVSPISELADYYYAPVVENPDPDYFYAGQGNGFPFDEPLTGPCQETYNYNHGWQDLQLMEENTNYQYLDGGDTSGSLWNAEDIWYTNYST